MQNINLYQSTKKAGTGPQTRQMLALAAAVLLVIVLHGLSYSWQLWQISAPLAQANQQAQQSEQALADLLEGFVEPALDPQLPLQLAHEEQDNQQLQQLAEHLRMLARMQHAGFVAPLQALSEQHPPAGLWLSSIALLQGGEQLRLDGFTQDQQLLPQYLHSLGRNAVFQGREFARFDIKREPSGLLQFRLSSTDAEEGASNE